jgi:amino acid adenylation domain-containing protein
VTGDGDLHAGALLSQLRDRIGALTGVPGAAVDPDAPFESLGIGSRDIVMLVGELEAVLGRELSPALAYEHPTPRRLAAALPAGELRGPPGSSPEPPQDGGVALVGLACRFPGAPDIETFRELLRSGTAVHGPYPLERREGRWRDDDLPGSFLPDVAGFDERFFNVSPHEAAAMDPQQRLALEVAYEALEDAGIAPETLAGSMTGVWFGISGNDYALLRAQSGRTGPYEATGLAHSVVANRVSYLLDLRGPSIACDTACSSSLVALHLARRALLDGECDLAIVGGVSLILAPETGRSFALAGMMAPDGRCKPFAASADGYGRGEGCGVVVLERLADARRANHAVRAVVLGSAVVNDGATNGLTAPNGAAQRDVLRHAYADAKIAPNTVAFVEAHGTGTVLGDRIEADALGDVVGAGRDGGPPCALGTLKAAIGHLEAAAGIAGVIKTVLGLESGELYPRPSPFEEHPGLRLAERGLAVVTAHRPWPRGAAHVAGVSSFGFGGTLAHVVLGAATPVRAAATAEPAYLVCLSARTDAALREHAARQARYLRAHPELGLAAVAATLAHGRAHRERRAAFVVRDTAELLASLDALSSGVQLANAAAPDTAELCRAASRYREGEPLDLAAIPASLARVPLPPTPFERRRHWMSASQRTEDSAPRAGGTRATRDRLVAELRAMVADLLGASADDVDAATPFLQLGADSILLLRASQAIRDRFGVDVSVRRLFEELDTLERVADAIAAERPSDPVARPEAAVVPAAAAAMRAAHRPDDAAVERIVNRQLELMAAQLALLRGEPATPLALPASTAAAPHDAPPAPQPLVVPPFRVRDFTNRAYTPDQRRWLDAFTRRYNDRTAASRDYAQRHRAVLADNRAVAGLRRATKDLLYPIVAVRSEGAHFWDADGNDYVDLAMGFGVNLFGHNPPFLRDALERRMREGIQIGVQSEQAGRAAELLAALTGKDRVCFVNTGSEAVMTALRLVRAASKRSRVVVFAGSYHGTFDGVLGRASTVAGAAAVPISPGVLPEMVHDLVVLDYGAGDSLAWIREHAGELAAVLVEGVQSRAPDLQPVAFVRALREITREMRIFLVFDEVLTGFRNGQRGAQGFYGIEADVATYGKVVASGIPIGVVAGCSEVMDYIDGGQWSFGDDSMPRDIETAFFGGTFCKHPLAMAAAVAVLEELERCGPALQAGLNATTERLARRLNALFEELHVPIEMVFFGSLFRFKYPGDLELLYFALIERGVYLWEGRNCFLSTAHGERDLDRVVDAFRSALLELLSVGLIARKDVPALAPAERPPRVATAAQRELWLLSLLDPRISAAYNESVVLELTGALRPELLRDAFARVFARHEALGEGIAPDGRTRVRGASEEPPFEMLEHVASDDPLEEWFAARVDAALRAPFDLARPPLLRVLLLACASARHRLVIVAHHAALDGWSLGVVVRDVLTCYADLAAGREPQVPAAPSFSAHADALAAYRSGPAYAEDEAFWRNELAAAPADATAPAGPVAARRCGTLRPALRARLLAAAARHGCTPFMLLFGAFAVVLHRFSGRDELVIGVPASLRALGEERLVGNCTNLLAVRSTYRARLGVDALLAGVRATFARTMQHVRYPFAEAVRLLGGEAGGPRSVVASFNLERRVAVPQPAGLDVALLPSRGAFAKLPLHANVTEIDDALLVEVDVAADRYDAETAARFLHAYVSVLEAIVDGDGGPAGRLPLLRPSDRAQAVGSLAGAHDDVAPRDDVVHAAFSRSAGRCPGAIAASSRDEQVTFGELEERANAFAHRLRAAGARPGTTVAVALPRAPELLVALLGVLKAGAAYVPLEPSDPAQRLRTLVEDCGARIVVSREHDPFLSLPVRMLAPAAGDTAPDPPAVDVRADDAAYVIYTSGSTGRPKGVVMTHRGLVGYLRWAVGAYAISDAGGAPAYSSVAFDLTVTSLFGPLLAGRPVHFVAADRHGLGALYAAFEHGGGFSLVKTTPAHLALLASEPPRAGLRGQCATLVVGGDQLYGETLAAWRAAGVRIVNEYGPTEAAVGCCAYEVAPGDPATGPVPIGRPIANVRLYVVDDELEPVPPGVVGELLIGGDGLARGYLGRPRETAAAFVPDPFGEIPGARLYRTGDRVRMRADGNLEYVGRRDRQVKVRGHRVELGEVENVLIGHAAVREAAVVAEGDGEDRRLVAYVVARDRLDEAALRVHAAERLPAACVPAAYVVLDALPLTRNGKIDVAALPRANRLEPVLETNPTTTPDDTTRAVAEIWRTLLGRGDFDASTNFFDAGGHSLLLPALRERLSAAFGREISLLDLFRHPTISDHVRLAGPVVTPSLAGPETEATEEPVAIVGIAVRLPGADTAARLWELVAAGRTALLPPAGRAGAAAVRAGGRLDGIDLFDAAFFGMTPREAELLDPQHRVFIECAWRALEDAAIDSERRGARIGVFACAALNTYLLENVLPSGRLSGEIDARAVALGGDKDFLATRVAYALDLHGPALAVQTACSSSLVAVHLAVRSLRAHECDAALAGGVAIRVPQDREYPWQEGGIESPDGRCRAFGADAAGTVFGNGAGVVALKRLSEAVRDGDRIYALIRGSAVTNDGARKPGFAAPSIEGQREAIAAALAAARVDASAIGYVEAHGTGTPLGDRVELAGLREALGDEGVPCVLGSVKSNVGHLDTAAGVIGLAKAALALFHRTLPPQPGFGEPADDPAFRKRFAVLRESRPWETEGRRFAGVSSFGIGGTNAHAVLEEPPRPRTEISAPQPRALLVSAGSETALARLTAGLAAVLRDPAAPPLADVAFTLASGRRRFAHRRAVVAADAAAAAAALEGASYAAHGIDDSRGRPVAFLFPGQGAQAPRMSLALFAAQPVFAATLERCVSVLAREHGVELRDVLIGERASERLTATALVQPALFAVEYALAELWRSWGVVPAGMLGHSLGEYVAATIAGVFTLDDALGLVAARGRLMQTAPAGAMLAIAASGARVEPLLEDAEIAAFNAPDQIVAAGTADAMRRLEARLTSAGIASRPLPTSHAFHCALVDPVLDAFAAVAASVPRSAPRLPFVSNVTGLPIEAEQATSVAYWVEHLRRPVRFETALRSLLREPATALLEIGPGNALTALARRADPNRIAVPTLERPGRPDEGEQALTAMSRLWVRGVDVDPRAAGSGGRAVSIPGHPLDPQRHWLEPADAPEPARTWRGWRPVWRRATAPAGADEPAAWAIAGTSPSTAALARALGGASRVIDAGDAAAVRAAGTERFAAVVRSGDDATAALLTLARRLGETARPAQLCVITVGGVASAPAERAAPDVAEAAGAVLAAHDEYPALSLRIVDVPAERDDDLAALVRELRRPPAEGEVALRGAVRLVPALEAWAPPPGARLFVPGGSYLLTGAFGRIGLAVADELVGRLGARAVLLGHRSAAQAPQDVRERLEALTARGAHCLAGDAAEPAALRAAVEAAIREHGALDGVIHLAGITGAASLGTIAHTSASDIARHRRPKLDALRALADAIEGRGVAFVCVASSLASLLGGFGLAAYAAASRSADAFASARDGEAGTRWIVLDWDAWNFGADDAHGRRRALPPHDGVASLLSLPAHDAPGRLVIGVDAPVLRSCRAPSVSVHAAETGSDVRTALASMWADVLGVRAAAPDQDFFACGGDSLAALRLIARVRERFSVDLPLRRFLEAPTLGALESALAGSGDGAPPPERSEESEKRHGADPDVPGSLPLSSGQRRLWAYEQLSRGDPGTVRVNVLDIAGAPDVGALRSALDALGARHDVLRARIVAHDGSAWLRYADEAAIRLEVVDFGDLAVSEREPATAAAIDAAAERRFDLAEETPVRALLARLAPDRFRLALFAHHAAIDGWSTAILADELGRLYSAFSRAAAPELPAAGRFADAERWQSERLTPARRGELVAWWREELRDAPVFDLQPERPRRAGGRRAAVAPHRPPAAFAAALREGARAERCSRFTVLFAAVASLLHARTGSDDLVVGTAVAQRDFPDAERTVGFFVNTVPLRIRLDGEPSLGDVVARAAASVHGALAHHDLPFDELVSALAPPRLAGVPPLVQVLLVFQNVPRVELAFDGLSVRALETERGAGQFDLVLDYAEDPADPHVLRGWWEYDPDRLAPEQVAELQQQLESIVELLHAAPERALRELASVRADRPALVERTLIELWRRVLRRDGVSREDDFFALGGDSIAAIRFAAAAREAGLSVHPAQLFDHPVLAELARALLAAEPAAVIEPVPVDVDVPLTPIQAWYLEAAPADPAVFAQHASLEIRRGIAAAVIREALSRLCERHSALRHRFSRGPRGWSQRIGADAAVAFSALDLSGVEDAGQSDTLRNAFAAARGRLDIERGPLLSAVHVLMPGDGPNRLLLVIHHLVIDGVSWRIVLDDLAALLEGTSKRSGASAPAPSYASWARELTARISGSAALDEHAAWWSRTPMRDAAGPWAGSRSGPDGEAQTLLQRIDRRTTTALLSVLPAGYGATTEDLLLAAFARALGESTTGAAATIVELEHHGRDAVGTGIDLSRTVGWFTAIFPVRIPLLPEGTPADWVRAIRAARVAHVPHGFAFLPLLQGARGPEIAALLRAIPIPDVGFNYLGRFEGSFGPLAVRADDRVPPARGPRTFARLAIETTLQVVDDALTVEWRFDPARVGASDVAALADRFAGALGGMHATQTAGVAEPSVVDAFAPTPMQQAIALHALLTPDSDAYRELTVARLHGTIDADAFARAWGDVVARHDALRAGFAWTSREGPVQKIFQRNGSALTLEDRRGVDASVAEADAVRDDSARPFDLSAGPLVRVRLIRTAEAAWSLLISHHHVALDGWSLPLVVRDVFAAYQARCAGTAPGFAPAVPLRRYADWLAERDTDAEREFWRAELADLPAVPALGGDAASGDFVRLERDLGTVATAALERCARETRVTLNALAVGAWGLVLRATLARPEVVVGNVVAGRPVELAGVSELVGMLMNVVPVRVAFDRNAAAGEALQALHRRLATIRRYETTSLADVRRWLGLKLSEELFDTALVVENYPVPLSLDEPVPGVRIASIETVEHSDRTAVVTLAPGSSLRIGLTYAGTRLSAATAHSLLDRYVALLSTLPGAVAAETKTADLDVTKAAAGDHVRAFLEML